MAGMDIERQDRNSMREGECDKLQASTQITSLHHGQKAHDITADGCNEGDVAIAESGM